MNTNTLGKDVKLTRSETQKQQGHDGNHAHVVVALHRCLRELKDPAMQRYAGVGRLVGDTGGWKPVPEDCSLDQKELNPL